MELITERFVAISLLAIGLSHVCQPGQWSELFGDLIPKRYSGLVIGTFTLPLGLYIILTHNIWVRDWPVFITIVGWGWTIKATLYLLIPGFVQRVATADRLKPSKFVAAGALFAIGGGLLTWCAFSAPISA
jgi:hypothetical protein